jgi:hypothetical protein
MPRSLLGDPHRTDSLRGVRVRLPGLVDVRPGTRDAAGLLDAVAAGNAVIPMNRVFRLYGIVEAHTVMEQGRGGRESGGGGDLMWSIS